MTMSVTVLGARTPYPAPNEPCSGYLLRAADRNLWIDAGAGTLAELQRHVELAEIHAIWISHLHPDHYADLLAAWNAYANDGSLPRPTVYGPPSWDARLDAMLARQGAAAKVFDVVELEDGARLSLGEVELRAVAVHHSVPTFAVRAEAGGRVFAYGADSGPMPALVELARGAGLFVAEAGADTPQAYHCTPEDAGAAAEEAVVGQLVLTHLAPGLDVDDAIARCRTTFSGAVAVAKPGHVLAV